MAILIQVLDSELHQVFGKNNFGQTKLCESFINTSLKPIVQNSQKKIKKFQELKQYNSFKFQHRIKTKPDLESCGKTIKNKNN